MSTAQRHGDAYLPSNEQSSSVRQPDIDVRFPLDAERIERTLAVLDSLLKGDAEEQRETLTFLIEALDEGRPDELKRF
jgi:hypothetical protein